MQLMPSVTTTPTGTAQTERSSRSDLYAILLFSPMAWSPAPSLAAPAGSEAR